ncbi:MAG: TIGR00153 family protein [Desulfobacteraceae bacterium]|jgi:predicted phosphate transport protein (TIGR00153 family)|nr:TIGR00153 family protein [Desulfobacteraceae bacterium]
MRIPFSSMFITSPFDSLQEHAEKVKECSWAFQQAMECYASSQCDTFEELRQDVARFENEADAIKRRIRGHLPKGVMMPVEKFQLFRYLREQDNVLDSVKSAISWLSFRPDAGIPEYAEKDFFLLIDAVIEPIEELTVMVSEARIYFKNFSEKQRQKIKEIITNLRQMEHEADKLEYTLIKKIFKYEKDPITLQHLVKLTEIIGNIADHAENTADMMRAMLAK